MARIITTIAAIATIASFTATANAATLWTRVGYFAVAQASLGPSTNTLLLGMDGERDGAGVVATVAGTGAAVSIEVSTDGGTWGTYGASLAAGSHYVHVPGGTGYIRLNFTACSSGCALTATWGLGNRTY